MTNVTKVAALLTSQKPLLFLLDYDGTLTDFKKDPNQSFLSLGSRRGLRQLQKRHPVVIVTGRYLDRLYQISKLKFFPAIGTHGFESRNLIKGLRFASPSLQKKYQREALAIWSAVKTLRQGKLGVHIEKKPFSSTLHYRGAKISNKAIGQLEKEFVRLCRKNSTPALWTFQKGKKMVEVMPKGFSKGKAVKKLLGYYPGYTAIFAGDDVADIAALKAVGKKGIRVAVGHRIPGKYWDLRFNSPKELIQWLRTFIR